MNAFSAEQYLDGGPVTYGGVLSWEISKQPAGLIRVWDAEGEAWGEFTDSIGLFWTPVDGDGWPIPDQREVTWAELLQEWGPVTDDAPAAKPADPPTRCGWASDCTKAAADDYDQLCAEHLAPIAAGRIGYVAEVLLSETPGAGRDGE